MYTGTHVNRYTRIWLVYMSTCVRVSFSTATILQLQTNKLID